MRTGKKRGRENHKCSATVILPTLNEEENIDKIAAELLGRGYRVIVSDDGSTDRTRGIVERLATVDEKIIFFDHSKMKRGLAGSILDAAKIVRTEKIIVMDADFQHPVEKTGELVSALDNVELAVACRTKNENWGIARQAISFGANALARFVLFARNSASCSDPVSGFFGFRKNLLRNIDERRVVGNGLKVLVDILKQLDRSAKVAEVPYVFAERKKGSSKIGISHIFLFLRSLVS